LYQLVGPGYTVDTAKLRVTGDLMAGGESTGVKVEIRAGGPAIGYRSAAASRRRAEPGQRVTRPSASSGLAWL
jgi:hypothetical protein